MSYTRTAVMGCEAAALPSMGTMLVSVADCVKAKSPVADEAANERAAVVEPALPPYPNSVASWLATNVTEPVLIISCTRTCSADWYDVGALNVPAPFDRTENLNVSSSSSLLVTVSGDVPPFVPTTLKTTQLDDTEVDPLPSEFSTTMAGL